MENTIFYALTKLHLEDEEELCPYIPHKDLYLHRFAFRKLKAKNPNRLEELIKEYILDVDVPKKLKWSKEKKYGEDKFSSQRGYVATTAGKNDVVY